MWGAWVVVIIGCRCAHDCGRPYLGGYLVKYSVPRLCRTSRAVAFLRYQAFEENCTVGCRVPPNVVHVWGRNSPYLWQMNPCHCTFARTFQGSIRPHNALHIDGVGHDGKLLMLSHWCVLVLDGRW